VNRKQAFSGLDFQYETLSDEYIEPVVADHLAAIPDRH
jgi:hypothetical protein